MADRADLDEVRTLVESHACVSIDAGDDYCITHDGWLDGDTCSRSYPSLLTNMAALADEVERLREAYDETVQLMGTSNDALIGRLREARVERDELAARLERDETAAGCFRDMCEVLERRYPAAETMAAAEIIEALADKAGLPAGGPALEGNKYTQVGCVETPC